MFCLYFSAMFHTESQNRRMAGDGRDLCGSSSPTPHTKAGPPRAGFTPDSASTLAK